MTVLQLSDLRDNLEKCPKNVSASLIAMLEETTLSSVLKDKFKFSNSSLSDLISARVKEISNQSEQQLLDQLVMEMSLAAEVQSPDTTPASIYWMRQILDQAAISLKIDPTPLSDDAVLKEVLNKAFAQFVERIQEGWKSLSTEERQKVVNAWIDNLNSSGLSDREKLEVAKAIGVDELSLDAIKPAIVSTMLVSLVSMGVASSGFGIYIAATTLMHTVMTSMLGITLPFAMYTGLTTSMGLLISPLGAFALGAGLLFRIGSQKSKEIKKHLLTLVLLQLAQLS